MASSRCRRVSASVVSLDAPLDDASGKSTPAGALISDGELRRHAGVPFHAGTPDPDLRMDVREVTASAPPALQKFAAVLCHVPQFAAGKILGLTRRQAAAMAEQLGELFLSAGLEPDVQSLRPSRM
jgi:hypothetical protein